jgi:uncharacterized OB-fold protein
MQTAATPARVLGLYDRAMWDLLDQKGQLHLQRCTGCGIWRYPPGPACPDCLSPDAQWLSVSGRGEILSWVIFHKEYLPEYPVPYNVIAVRLDEGPIMVSNLLGEPDNELIGTRVRLQVVRMADGVSLPRFAPDRWERRHAGYGANWLTEPMARHQPSVAPSSATPCRR